MGFILEKEQTRSTPYILIDEDASYIKFEGKSFHERVVEFYNDVTMWLDTYLTTNFEAFTFDCKLEYFNSSTAKLLLNMLKGMDKAAADGKRIIVNWAADEGNEVITECVEDFQEELDHFEINLIFI